MADSERNSNASIPWPAILAILAAGGGLFVLFSKLESSRPDADMGTSPGSVGWQDVQARLWQDPFKAVQQQRRGARNDGGGPAVKEPPSRTRKPDELRQQIIDATPKFVLVLPIMVPTGPYAELTEGRLRTRVAVLEGLARCGLVPDDTEHIGYIEVPWLWTVISKEMGARKTFPPAADASKKLPVPYEWCRFASVQMRGVDPSTSLPGGRTRVLVLWIDEDAITDYPLKRLDALLQSILNGPGTQCSTANLNRADLCVKMIGPYTSGTLRAMVVEAAKAVAAEKTAPAANVNSVAARAELENVPLKGAVMFVPTATAQAATLLVPEPNQKEWPPLPGPEADDPEYESALQKLLRCTYGLQLIRTTITDDELCSDMLEEMQLRLPSDRPRHLAMVSEWDTFYGRALPENFEVESLKMLKKKLMKKTKESFIIRAFVYLRGIDGKAPSESGKAGNSGKNDSSGNSQDSSADAGIGTNLRKSQGPLEAPEGTNQIDYLRRMADRLADWDEALRRHGSQEQLDGVAVLGTDVYDTLLVIQALRDRVPNALFFTSTLDARYAMGSEWPTTHNLLIVSPYGLRLHPSYQGSIAPFRDCYQTAVFAATLAALGRLPQIEQLADLKAEPLRVFGEPRRFEIGRHGAFDLTDRVNHGEPDKSFELQEDQQQEDVWKKNSHVLGAYDPELAASALTTGPTCIQPPRTDYSAGDSDRQSRIWAPVAAGAALGLLGLILAVPSSRRPSTRRLVRILLAGWRARRWRPFGLIRLVCITWPSRRCNLIRITSSLPVSLFLAASASWALLTWGPRQDGDRSEPLAMLEGISSWPSEVVRIFALALCIHFLFKVVLDTKENDKKITRWFSLKDLKDWAPGPSEHFLEQEEPRSKLLLGDWTIFGPAWTPARAERELSEGENAGVYAQNLWWEYRRRATCGPRLARAAMLTGFYCLFIFALVYTLGFPHAPVRGPTAQFWDSWILGLSSIAAVALLMFILDGTYLNRKFIRHLTQTDTHWPKRAFEKFAKDVPSEDLTEYGDIRFIAMRTRVAGEVIYYPFLIFSLLIVARNSWFTDWPWSTGIIAIFTLNMVVAALAAWMLRSAAEKARAAALRKIHDRSIRHAAKKDDPMSEALKQIADLVANERDGAFSILSRHPILGAILLPSGGLGIWALLQFLAK